MSTNKYKTSKSNKNYKDHTHLVLGAVRQHFGMFQSDMARIIGTTQGNYSKLEAGGILGLSAML